VNTFGGQQPVDEQERVAGPGVAGQHDDRAGRQFLPAEFWLFYLDVQAVGPFGSVVQVVQ
jgi:hypothetical protein